MHFYEIERGMWIEDLGIVPGTREPGESGAMATARYVDPNDREFVMVTLTDDEHYEEHCARGTRQWAE